MVVLTGYLYEGRRGGGGVVYKPAGLCSCFHSVLWLIELVVVSFAPRSSPALNLQETGREQNTGYQ